MFSLEAFVGEVVQELIEIGDLNDFEFCRKSETCRGLCSWLYIDANENTESITLNLIVTDYDQRTELETLTHTELSTWFRRLLKFFKKENHTVMTSAVNWILPLKFIGHGGLY